MNHRNENASLFLNADESILSVSVVDMKGAVVEFKSKYNIPSAYENREPDFGVWIKAAFAMSEHLAKRRGKAEAFVSIHKSLKLVVLPLMNTGNLLVLTMLPSANTEFIIGKINLLMPKQARSAKENSEFDGTVTVYRNKNEDSLNVTGPHTYTL